MAYSILKADAPWLSRAVNPEVGRGATTRPVLLALNRGDDVTIQSRSHDSRETPATSLQHVLRRFFSSTSCPLTTTLSAPRIMLRIASLPLILYHPPWNQEESVLVTFYTNLMPCNRESSLSRLDCTFVPSRRCSGFKDLFCPKNTPSRLPCLSDVQGRCSSSPSEIR